MDVIHANHFSQCNRQCRAEKESGFTLIEILVSLIILAVGFLGMAALQSSSMQGTASTYFRTQADMLANDLSERIRANRTGSEAGAYAYGGGGATSASCGSADSCNSASMAEADISEWSDWVENSLPSGDATVTELGQNFWAIQVMWDERRNGATGTGCDASDETDLACLVLNVQVREADPNRSF
ncbi:MAG: type IV pilus modification protein PilV [Pseudomonadales bacterium]